MPELLLQRGDVFVDPFAAVAFVLPRSFAADEALDDAFLMPTGTHIGRIENQANPESHLENSASLHRLLQMVTWCIVAHVRGGNCWICNLCDRNTQKTLKSLSTRLVLE